MADKMFAVLQQQQQYRHAMMCNIYSESLERPTGFVRQLRHPEHGNRVHQRAANCDQNVSNVMLWLGERRDDCNFHSSRTQSYVHMRPTTQSSSLLSPRSRFSLILFHSALKR